MYLIGICSLCNFNFNGRHGEVCAICLDKEIADLQARLTESQNAVHAHSVMIEGLEATIKDREDEIQKAEGECVAKGQEVEKVDEHNYHLNKKLQKEESESERLKIVEGKVNGEGWSNR